MMRRGTNSFIEKTQTGEVFAENNWKHEVTRLVELLKRQIENKRAGKPVMYKPNLDEIKKYDHDTLVLQLEEIIRKCGDYK